MPADTDLSDVDHGGGRLACVVSRDNLQTRTEMSEEAREREREREGSVKESCQ